MKALIVALCLTSTVAFAQEPPAPPTSPGPARNRIALPFNVNQQPAEANDILPGNYLLTFSANAKDEDKPVFSIVVASTAPFHLTTPDNSITFDGTLAAKDDGSVMVRYHLAVQTTVKEGSNDSIRTGSCQSSVILRLDEPVKVITIGSMTVKLSVSKLAQEREKKK